VIQVVLLAAAGFAIAGAVADRTYGHESSNESRARGGLGSLAAGYPAIRQAGAVPRRLHAESARNRVSSVER
jgi:hypothetical protein